MLCTYIGANAYCHLIGRDDENILSSCIDQSDDTIHLLRYMHTKQQRFFSFFFFSHQSISQRGVRTPLKSNWTLRVKLLLEGGGGGGGGGLYKYF